MEEGRLQGQDQVGHHSVFAGRLEGGAERNIRPGYLEAISNYFIQRVVVGDEVVSVKVSGQRGPEFESTCCQGCFTFLFYQQQSVLNQDPQEKCIFCCFSYNDLCCTACGEAGLNTQNEDLKKLFHPKALLI